MNLSSGRKPCCILDVVWPTLFIVIPRKWSCNLWTLVDVTWQIMKAILNYLKVSKKWKVSPPQPPMFVIYEELHIQSCTPRPILDPLSWLPYLREPLIYYFIMTKILQFDNAQDVPTSLEIYEKNSYGHNLESVIISHESRACPIESLGFVFNPFFLCVM